MSDHDLGGPAPLAPSTAYLDRMEEETARRAARTSPIDSPYAGAPEESTATELLPAGFASHQHPDHDTQPGWQPHACVDPT